MDPKDDFRRYVNCMCLELGQLARLNNWPTVAHLLEMASLETQSKLSLQPNVTGMVVQQSVIGIWDWDVVRDLVYADAAVANYFGLDPTEAILGLPIKRFVSAVHASDSQGLENSIEYALKTGEEFSAKYRVKRSDNKLRWVYARGRVQMDTGGRALRFPGVIVDITQEQNFA